MIFLQEALVVFIGLCYLENKIYDLEHFLKYTFYLKTVLDF